MSKIWFTSDTHFNQKRTLDLSKRPFANVTEMNRVLVTNWNETVKSDDIVYHLGDFGDYKFREYLNGNIILIKGNYERNDKEEFKMTEHYFNQCYEIMYSVCIPNKESVYFLNMTHEPNRLKIFSIDDNHINLFGHVHKLCMIKSYGINVGVDCHNFKPIDLETVLFYHNGIFNYYDKDVFY